MFRTLNHELLNSKDNHYFLFTGAHKVQCTDDLMKVDIVLLEDNIDPSSVYLEGMKGYPEPKCQPIISDHVARFQLSLLDFYECGVTRVVYKLNVRIALYLCHRL